MDDTLRPSKSWTPLELPPDWPPTLAVVIDTEEEFDWDADFDPAATSTTNIECQPLAQEVMDRHGIVPTYVVDYPVAATPASSRILRAIAESGRCEIGAHLHPWVCPPYKGPVDNFHSYPGNLPAPLERAKLENLTRTIENAFGRRPIIYKAGRYGLGPATFETLRDVGFQIDASVVPHTDFSGQSGPNFTGFPAAPFRTQSGVTELPLSVHFSGALATLGPWMFPWIGNKPLRQLRVPGIFARLKLLERLRLSPEGHTLDDMIRQTHAALGRGQKYFMLTYHSSSLLPGANGYVRDDAARAYFLTTLDRYFSFFMGECGGQTMPVTTLAETLAGTPTTLTKTGSRARKLPMQ